MTYTEIDYYYDGTLNAVICNNCIKQYEIDNADYTNLDTISSHKYWEGEPLICDECNGRIESEYGEPEERKRKPIKTNQQESTMTIADTTDRMTSISKALDAARDDKMEDFGNAALSEVDVEYALLKIGMQIPDWSKLPQIGELSIADLARSVVIKR